MGESDGGREWAHRQQAQATAFDVVGVRYDEVFPHKDGQIRCGELLLARLAPAARVLDVGCGRPISTTSAVGPGSS